MEQMKRKEKFIGGKIMAFRFSYTLKFGNSYYLENDRCQSFI